jgi:DEAD/DEAH box helicase domain-containing protein
MVKRSLSTLDNDDDDNNKPCCSPPAFLDDDGTKSQRTTVVAIAHHNNQVVSESLINSLSLLDPILQFLTRATGQTLVPLERLHQTMPTIQLSSKIPWLDLEALIDYGIIHVHVKAVAGDKETKQKKGIDHVKDILPWKNQLKEQWDDHNQVMHQQTQTASSKKIEFLIGFHSGLDTNTSEENRKLCGSSKTAAKRRLAALKQRIKQTKRAENFQTNPSIVMSHDTPTPLHVDDSESAAATPLSMISNGSSDSTNFSLSDDAHVKLDEEIPQNLEMVAKEALGEILGLTLLSPVAECTSSSAADHPSDLKMASALIESNIPSVILPQQLSYAGSYPGQIAEFDSDELSSSSWQNNLHPVLRDAFLGKQGCSHRRQLYRHQAAAIQSALQDQHTLVCTGTGSGKSLCFWIPIIQQAIEKSQKSLVIFPTKALAQDQLVKLQSILQSNPLLTQQFNIQAATLDGDTPHAQRALIATTCCVILTNPDTLHASILPNWKSLYKNWIRDLKYVVVDEAHMYEGVFGAHVAMVLARLYRVHCCCASERDPGSSKTFEQSSKLVFLSGSATLAYPEQHLRLLCRIPFSQPVTVLKKDSSPKASKHFFVWNPPLLDENGRSLGFVSWPKRKKQMPRTTAATEFKPSRNGNKKSKLQSRDEAQQSLQESCEVIELSSDFIEKKTKNGLFRKDVRRRHAAEETALLLARAVILGVKCIAFCKTRCLVEWVYERCISALKHCPDSQGLIPKVDSYRGGYSKIKRREIEDKLFRNQLLGVVGTSALELGVDIKGVELTLHCGFPSSHTSLMQQAGRAGRGGTARPSLAICVCFNSPVDQHLWRHPSSLLQRAVSAPLTMPIYSGLVQGHLLCASQEFPLTGSSNVTVIQSIESPADPRLVSDEELFGSKETFLEALKENLAQGNLSSLKLPIFGGGFITVHKAQTSSKRPWKNVSIRSIEFVNYDIVDLSHPMQANRMDGSHCADAVLVRFGRYLKQKMLPLYLNLYLMPCVISG